MIHQLATHIRTVHQGIKDYKCEFCGNLFKSLDGMNKHIRTVHEGHKDYKCEYCNESRTTGHSLRKHILRTHPNAKKPIVRPNPYTL